MKEAILTVKNQLGVHTRAASEIARTASRFKSNIILIKGDLTANAKSILGILILGASCGEKIKVIVDGVDEETALLEIKKLFENGFYE